MKKCDFKFKNSYKKAVILEIITLRNLGASYTEIAELFNKEGYDTFSGNGKWYTQSVHRLYHNNKTTSKPDSVLSK